MWNCHESEDIFFYEFECCCPQAEVVTEGGERLLEEPGPGLHREKIASKGEADNQKDNEWQVGQIAWWLDWTLLIFF